MYLLFSVSSSAAEQLKPHLIDIISLIAVVLQDQQSNLAPFYAIKLVVDNISLFYE